MTPPGDATIADIQRTGETVWKLANTFGCGCQYHHGGNPDGTTQWFFCEYHAGFIAGASSRSA
jgi:hypothetical protein